MNYPLPNAYYRTSDFWLAAVLLASDEKLIRLSWDGPRATFTFEDMGQCESRTNAHWNNDLKISSRSLVESARTLKDLLHGKQEFALAPQKQICGVRLNRSRAHL